MSFFNEFKEFAVKGNAVDMAVGIILGLAFGKVINSVVQDLIMPPIGLLLGGVDFSSLRAVLKPANPEAGTPEVAIRYGVFVNTVIEFLIIAFSVFVIVKFMNMLIRRREMPKAAPA